MDGKPVWTIDQDSLAEEILRDGDPSLDDAPWDAVVAFYAARRDHPALIEAVRRFGESMNPHFYIAEEVRMAPWPRDPAGRQERLAAEAMHPIGHPPIALHTRLPVNSTGGVCVFCRDVHADPASRQACAETSPAVTRDK